MTGNKRGSPPLSHPGLGGKDVTQKEGEKIHCGWTRENMGIPSCFGFKEIKLVLILLAWSGVACLQAGECTFLNHLVLSHPYPTYPLLCHMAGGQCAAATKGNWTGPHGSSHHFPLCLRPETGGRAAVQLHSGHGLLQEPLTGPWPWPH